MKVFLQKIKALAHREQGFTLAELLVGLLVFGVLASIAVPMLLSQKSINIDNSLKADLANASINLESTKSDNGGKYPDAAPDNIVLTSENAQLKYTYPFDRMAYCLQIISGDRTFFRSNTDAEATTTDCTYEYLVPSTKLSGQMDGFKPVLTWRTVASATSYVIYKNNIPVKTVTLPSSTSVTSTSYTLPAMNPEESASFYIVVQDGATASPQSNVVTLKAPVPPPVSPTLKLIASDVKSSTMQQYTLQWANVRYATGYELWDTTGIRAVIDSSISSATTVYKIDKKRGETLKVVLKSKNSEGTSADSNELTLSTAWPAAAIISATSNPADGKINFVFQNESNGARTPDWGTGSPNSSVRLKVTETGTGAVVLDQSGITTSSITPNKVFNRLTHTASIIVTTSTGVVLGESAPVTITFPKPTTPAAVAGFKGTTGGTATISPNRLSWNAVTCSTSSTAEYYITHDANKYNSGWISDTVLDVPQPWLAQATDEAFTIVARCTNGNGTSANSPVSNTVFTTGVNTPDTINNVTSVNRTAAIKWDAAVCATGTSAEYTIKQTLKNDSIATDVYTAKTNSYTLPGVTDGAKQTVEVAARCVVYNPDGVTVKAASSWTDSSLSYTWTTPLPKPVAPTLTLTSKTVSSPRIVDYKVTWNTVAWAQSYEIFDAADPSSPIATTGIDTTSTTVKADRGTTMKIYVVAVNSDGRSNNSNVLSLVDTWPTPVILETETYPYEGTIRVKWQNGTDDAPTPDWGKPGYKVKVNVYNARTGVTKTYDNIVAREFITTDELPREDHTVRIYVTTATGVELASASVVATFPPPGPPAPVTGLATSNAGTGAIKANRLVWNQASCGGSSPEYLITNTDGSGNSGWVTGTVSGSTVYYDLPQGWLKQGFTEPFTVAARCTNPNGTSAASANASVSFNASVLTPAAVTGVDNDGVDLVTWTHSTPPTGLSREYQITTITKNGVAFTESKTTTNASYQMTGLTPDKDQKVYVQVRFYNPANGITSAWSPNVTSAQTAWKTPKPVPVAPVITLQSSAVASPTMQRYTITWPAVQWAENYRLVDSSDSSYLKDGIAGTATSVTIDLPRGSAATNVALRAYNTTGSSVNSNVVKLEAPWPTPVISSVTTQRAGSATLVWQNGTYPSYTPDWGTPGYKVDLEIRKDSSSTGAVVYTQTGLTTPKHDSTVFAATPALRGGTNYYAQITVTTATGDTLTSAWKNFKFEIPINPGRVTNLRSDAGGPGTVKNDRLLWDAVTCTQPGAYPEYYVRKVTPGSTTTGIVMLMNWTANVTSFVIPQSHLVGIQGEQIAFTVLSHCEFPEGDASSWTDGVVGGDGYHEFTVGIAPPTVDPGTPTRASLLNNTINWSAATCGTGTSPSYTITKTIHNGAASTLKYTTTGLTYALPSITAGTNQSVQVSAKCIKDTDATKFSSEGDLSAVYSYRSPLPTPAAPVITEKNTVVASPTISTVNIGWTAVANAEFYDIYNATTGVKLSTVSGSTTTAPVSVTRGSTGSVKVYVKAGNFTATGAASNTLTLDAPWPAAAVLSAVPNQNKQIDVKWQTSSTSPDWGDPNDRIVVYVEQPAGTLVYTSPAQTGTGMLVTVPNAVASVVYIKVTTANGEVLTSPDFPVNFVMPATPAKVTNLTITNNAATPIGPDVLKWDAVTCSVPDTDPQYYVRQYVEGSTTTSKYATGWVINTNTYTMPQAQLGQGVIYTYGVYSRCVSGNGASADGGVVQATAARTNVLPPAAPANFRVTSNSSNGTSIVAWDAVTCPSNLTAGYAVYFTLKNGAASTSVYYVGTDTTDTYTGLTPDTSHTAYVKSRCYDATDTTITSTWANGNASNTATWKTPIPVPVAPVLSSTQTADNNLAGTTTNSLSWPAVNWATSYTVYDAVTNAGLYTGSATNFTVTVTKNTVKKYYVVATNTSGTGPKSNVVTVAPTYDDPVINRTDLDDFTMRAAFWYQNITNTWGSGATAQMISDGYGTYTATGSSFAKANHVRSDKVWYLQVTTTTGDVLTSAPVTISTKPLPTFSVTHNAQNQQFTYSMPRTPSYYGLNATNSSWRVEVSNSSSFTNSYPQSAASGTNPSVTSDVEIMPTHGDRYYARYIITRTSDGAEIGSSTDYADTPTKTLDRTSGGTRTLPIIDTSAGASSKFGFVPFYPYGHMAYNSTYTDPRVVGTSCILQAILDFTGPGSQGILCWHRANNQLIYYPISASGAVGAGVVKGNGWNMYSEVIVVQNFWGDDRPAIVGINDAAGNLEIWHTDPNNGGAIVDVDRASGTGWGPGDAASISTIRAVYDWNGYGTVGWIASSMNTPWTRYYGSRKVPTNTGGGNVIAGVSLLTSWNATVGQSPYFPSSSTPNSKSSYQVSRDYGNVVVNGKVVPAIAYGPINYYDVAVGTGAGAWSELRLNQGFPDNSAIRYSGQFQLLTQ